ncbi:hypothetical protein MRX96_023918 [Rhipicephalus microplus]
MAVSPSCLWRLPGAPARSSAPWPACWASCSSPPWPQGPCSRPSSLVARPRGTTGASATRPTASPATAYLHDKLNPLVEPCRNFADYVCGRLRGPGSVMDQVFSTKLYCTRSKRA